MTLTEIETPVGPPVPVRFNTFTRGAETATMSTLIENSSEEFHYRNKILRYVTEQQREILAK